MNKKELIDYLEEKKEYLNMMQSPFGHHSWWYSNRKSNDCINCKVYAWVDTSKVLALLSDTEKKKMELLGLDIDKICNEYVWGDDGFEYSWIWQAREDVLYNLHERYPEVVDITYQGNQGGWACIQFGFDIKSNDGWTLEDTLDNAPLKELRELKKQVDEACKKIDDLTEYYKGEHKKLCEAIENPKNYVDEVRNRIEQKEEWIKEELERKKETLQALKAL